MRKLSTVEIETVSGGFSVGPVHAVRPFGPSPVGLVAASFFAGYSIGTAIYNAYTSFRY